MDAEQLAEVVATVRRLREGFAVTADRAWDAVIAAAELQVQTGHLAVCALRQAGHLVAGLADSGRPLRLGDELADVVLAAVSVTVLVGTVPELTAAPGAAPSSVPEAALRITACAGALTEAGMVAAGYRHRPAGALPSVARAAGAVLAACEDLAALVRLDLMTEFRAMDADATAFLEGWRAS
ncbi:hypothetical protein I5Q34_34020 [Streptomyces sp. AV19]|uniref:hypothetical protein n=1 Tax=Streptomyces sp. AV19 TaxID=2793068 RepID=UPI0018FE24C2|nr:hypothetical protein [Streptomyces sp. AV19]MBH1939218.1 hypothetical protein [Streptomyces sp. AV19]MDG4537200.1 hypothetical protein [Streptomyces sp. AV19]